MVRIEGKSFILTSKFYVGEESNKSPNVVPYRKIPVMQRVKRCLYQSHSHVLLHGTSHEKYQTECTIKNF